MPLALDMPPRPAVKPDPGAVAAFYDQLAPRYDGAYSTRRERMENAALRFLLRSSPDLRPAFRSRAGDVLDLGCGTGLLLDLVPELSPEGYLGVDVSAGMLREAKGKHPRHAFLKADMLRLTGQPQTAAAAVSLFGAADYTRPGILALALKRYLRPGAPFLIMAMAQGYVPPIHNARMNKLLSPWPPRIVCGLLSGLRFQDVRARPFTVPWEGLPVPLPLLVAGQVIRTLTRAEQGSTGHRYVIFTGRQAA